MIFCGTDTAANCRENQPNHDFYGCMCVLINNLYFIPVDFVTVISYFEKFSLFTKFVARV